MRAREKCTTEIASLTVALEAVQAEMRAAEARLEALRTEHYAAGDALHDKQGAFYAANAEVTRLEQQLSFARESETRIAQQVAQLDRSARARSRGRKRRSPTSAPPPTPRCEARWPRASEPRGREQAAQAALPALEAAVQAAERSARRASASDRATEQAMRVAETRRDSAVRDRCRSSTSARRALDQELAAHRGARDRLHRASVEEQLAQENADLAGKQEALAALQKTVESLQARQRDDRRTRGSATASARRPRSARSRRLPRCRPRSATARTSTAGSPPTASTRARRLWQVLDIEPGWEDALEAVLRERLTALELARLDEVTAWVADGAQPPRRRRRLCAGARAPRAARAARRAARQGAHEAPRRRRASSPTACTACAAAPTSRRRSPSAMRWRSARRSSRRPGHLVTAQSVTFFAPDNELHGVLARQRELDELDGAIAGARDARRRSARAARCRRRRARRRRSRRITPKASPSARSSGARTTSSSSSCSCGRPPRPRSSGARRSSRKRPSVAARIERGAGSSAPPSMPRSPTCNRALHDELAAARSRAPRAQRGRGRAGARPRAGARGRARHAGSGLRASAAAATASPSSSGARAASRRRASSSARCSTQLTSERAADRLDAGRGDAAGAARPRAATAEQALAAARDRLEALGADLRAAEEARLAADQKLEPARAKIQDMQLKEQAAALAEQQFTEQLAEAHADVAALPDALKAWGSARTLPAEIERINAAIAELGAVNLAALDELAQARERKDYLDRQAADLTEAMTHARNGDPPDRPRIARAAAADVRRGQRELREAVPGAVRRRPGEARADRRGDPRLRRAGDRAAAGQAQHVDPPAVGRREGAHRDLAGVRAVPAQSGAVLPAGRGRRAARRSQHRPLLRDGARDGGRQRSSCSSRTTRSRWRWRTSSSASRCPSRAHRAWSRSTSPKR